MPPAKGQRFELQTVYIYIRRSLRRRRFRGQIEIKPSWALGLSFADRPAKPSAKPWRSRRFNSEAHFATNGRLGAFDCDAIRLFFVVFCCIVLCLVVFCCIYCICLQYLLFCVVWETLCADTGARGRRNRGSRRLKPYFYYAKRTVCGHECTGAYFPANPLLGITFLFRHLWTRHLTQCTHNSIQ